MRFLCKIGIHKWREVGCGPIIDPTPLYQCQRCNIGTRMSVLGYEVRYSAETMEEARKEFESKQIGGER